MWEFVRILLPRAQRILTDSLRGARCRQAPAEEDHAFAGAGVLSLYSHKSTMMQFQHLGLRATQV